MSTPTASERLAGFMNEARLERNLTWEGLAEAADFSSNHLRKIRRGDYLPSELSARAIENALRWKHGSVEAVLNGGDPTSIDDASDLDELLDAIYQRARKEGRPPEDIIAELGRRL